VGDLFQDLENHDAGALERRLAVTDGGVGHDVLAEFNRTLLSACFHRCVKDNRRGRRKQGKRKIPPEFFVDRAFAGLIRSAPDETVEQARSPGTRRKLTRPAALFNLLAGRPPSSMDAGF
jgi:hypothetical protein